MLCNQVNQSVYGELERQNIQASAAPANKARLTKNGAAVLPKIAHRLGQIPLPSINIRIHRTCSFLETP